MQTEGLNYTLFQYESGEAFVAAWEKERFDIIFMEIFMEDFTFILLEPFLLFDAEFCTVLGNLLENAVEACHRYDGNYQKTEGNFLPRKQGELRFGIGLESVRHTVERYGGTLGVFPDEERFV